MLEEDGINVATEDEAAWDEAVAEFKKTRRDASIELALSSVDGGDLVDPITVLGAANVGLDGSRSILA